MKTTNTAIKLAGLIAWVCVSPADPAGGAMLTDWTASDVLFIGDPGSDASPGARDIVRLWYRLDGGTHYFRMDLAAAPTQVAGFFANEYSINIDSGPGGGSASDTAYVPEGMSGIDQVLVSHFTLGGGWTVEHRHNYLGPTSAPPRVDTTQLGSLGGVFDSSEDAGGGAGTMLQWAVPAAALDAAPFSFRGATLYISGPQTFDVTRALATGGIPIEITSIATNASGGPMIRWTSVGGTRYRVEYVDNLATGTFAGIVRTAPQETESDVAVGMPDLMAYTDDFGSPQGSPAGGRRYYRVRSVVE